MASTSIFEFFEIIAGELTIEDSRVITADDIKGKHDGSSILDDLRRDTRAASTDDGIKLAVEKLKMHFQDKGSNLPFDYDETTGRFTARDQQYLQFVTEMAAIRSVGKRSRDFECKVAERLQQRVTGWIHRVGFPRDKKKNKKDFISHLKNLGFRSTILLGSEKDGGLDILWMLPIGAVPHRPILSVQCKNGEFDVASADISVGSGSRSLSEHSGLQPSIHVPCVLFNDYVHSEILTTKQMNFVPLGLSDLATLHSRVHLELL